MKKLNLFWSVLFLAISVPSMVLGQGMQSPSTGEDPHSRFRGGSMERMERPKGHPKVEGSKKGGMKGFSGHLSPFSVEGMKETLGLDEEQTKKMQDLLMNYRKGVIQKGAALRIAMIELEETIARPNLDLAAVEKKAKEKETAATELTMLRVRAMANAKEFLSDEQFDRFRNMIETRMAGGGSYRGMGRAPHGMSGMGMDMGGMEGMGGRSFRGRGGSSDDGYDD